MFCYTYDAEIITRLEGYIIDEIATVDIVAFTGSCLLSFLSLRVNNERSYRLEKIADIIFIAGISLLFVTAILFAFDVIA